MIPVVILGLQIVRRSFKTVTIVHEGSLWREKTQPYLGILDIGKGGGSKDWLFQIKNHLTYFYDFKIAK